MDPEQTFIRVQERFSEMLTPRIRATLEYFHLFAAITLFCILVVMHANYVQQPGCSSELQEIEASDAQLIQIKISSAPLWSQNVFESEVIDIHDKDIADEKHDVDPAEDEGPNLLSVKLWLDWISSGSSRGKSPLNFWKNHEKGLDSQPDDSSNSDSMIPLEEDVQKPKKDGSHGRFSISPKESLKAAFFHLGRKWYRRIYSVWGFTKRILGGLWDISGIHLNLDVPKWLKILHLDKLNSYAVQWLGKRSKLSEPTYLYTVEKGYLLLPDEARLKHNILTINVSISAWHPCFGNRWQQLLINRLVGYDTILMNSLLNSAGHGTDVFSSFSSSFLALAFLCSREESGVTPVCWFRVHHLDDLFIEKKCLLKLIHRILSK